MIWSEAERKCPLQLRRMLVDFGGVTPTGRPMWRLVQAGDCRILCQGTMHHFARGAEQGFGARNEAGETIERGGVTRPERIQGGIFLQPRYRDIAPRHWILQKWFPAHIWGTREQWVEAREEKGGRLFVEAFPSAGDYLMLAGPWSTLDGVGDLRVCLRQYLRFQIENPRDLEAHIRAEAAEEVAERTRKREKLEREIAQAEATLALAWKSASSSAQKVRNEMAARAGIAGHFGASEAWG